MADDLPNIKFWRHVLVAMTELRPKPTLRRVMSDGSFTQNSGHTPRWAPGLGTNLA